MNCDDIDNATYVYLDGEFAPPEEADFRAHVSACARCRSAVAQTAALMAEVQRRAPSPAAPQGLRARIDAALDAAPAPTRQDTSRRGAGRAKLPRWAPVVGALAALVIAFVLVGGTGGAHDERVLTESVAAHQGDLPMEVRGSETQIRRYLEDNVPFPVELGLADDPEVRLTGARLTRVGGRAAVLITYVLGEERMSEIQVASAAEAPVADVEPHVQSHRGFDVVRQQRRGVLSLVVGRGTSSRFRGLMRAAYRR